MEDFASVTKRTLLPGRLNAEKDSKDAYKKDHLLPHILPSSLLPQRSQQ